VEEAALAVGAVLAALVSVLRALPVLGVVVVGKGSALAAHSSSNNNSRSKEVSSKH
jgi:hypothetical protein